MKLYTKYITLPIFVICRNINWLLKCNNVDYYHTFIPLLQSNGIMKKILFVASLILLLPLFACLQSHVKSVEHLQSDYDRLHRSSANIIGKRSITCTRFLPLKVENDLREVELIGCAILK